MMGFGFMGFGWLMMAVFWIGIIFLTVWAVREFLPRSQATPGSASALDIAKARYARSEISKAEFEELKKALT